MNNKKKKKQQQKQLLVFGGIGAVILVAVVVLVIFIVSSSGSGVQASADGTPTHTPIPMSLTTPEPNIDDDQAAVDAIIYRTTMLEGTTIEGINVSGMTKEEAKAALLSNESAILGNISILINVAETSHALGSQNVNFSVNYDSAVNEAFNLVRTDNGIDAVKSEVESIRVNGHAIGLDITFDEASVRAYVAGLATEVDTPAINATVTAGSGSSAIHYTDEQPGRGIDQEALVSAIMSADNLSTINANFVELQPSLTRTMLEEQYVLRATFTTSYKGSSSNRKFNVNKGAEMMNGTILKPNDVFSCNDKLGVRSIANGWKLAGAYVQGNVDEQAGGGVCQLSSTLYNAVVMADLEIVYRQNHSMPVSYVDKGRDATINSVGNIIDFKFKNNTDSDIIIISYTTDNNKVTFEIYGVPFANDEYDKIDIRTERISKTDIVEEITEDPKQPVGYEEITQEGTIGYVYKAYKQYYKGSKLVREELLNNSTYRMYPTKKIVGTMATPEPSLPPSALPSTEPIVTPDPSSGTPEPTPYIPDL